MEDASDIQNFYTSDEVNPEVYTPMELIEWPRDGLDSLSAKRLKNTSPMVLAQYLERLNIHQRRVVLRQVDIEIASDILSEMDEEEAAETMSAMREHRAIEILEDFEPDDAADIMAEFDQADRDRFLNKMEPESREDIEELLEYDSETAGGLMTSEVYTADVDLTVKEAIRLVRRITESYESLHYIYIIDRDNVLRGIVSLRRLIKARPTQLLSDIMKVDIRGVVSPETDREEVALIMAEYNLLDIAVVDAEHRLLGIITHDDVLDVIQEEATEDIQKLAGAGGDESIHDDVTYSIRKRIPWLQINLLTAFTASAVVMLFREQISNLPLLAAYMPIIAGLGGNSGQQALAVSIRSMALGEIQENDSRKIISKQLLIGLFNGTCIGLIAALIAGFVTNNHMFAIVVFMAMILNMGLAGFSGAVIPLLLKKLNRDPAQSSSIFLTAITDTGGFLIFLSLGAYFLL